MTASRRKRSGGPRPGAALTRARVLAWLDQRLNFERVVPTAAGGGSFGLARMRRLLAMIGSPHKRFPVVHVAGTKGKGSTVAMLSAVLDEAGHRVGRYMSPHVHAIEERISVAGRPISSADLVEAFAVVMPAVEAMDERAARRGGRGPTWFETMTAVAFVHFVRSGIDLAVLETGLGGRLDATNVSQPVLSIITSISLDHTRILGPTIGRIATEKAGIIKRGCPVISGATNPAARKVITATAARRRAPLWQMDRDFHVLYGGPHTDPLAGERVAVVGDDERPGAAEPTFVRIGMPGRHQAANAALAIMAAHRLDSLGYAIPELAIRRGLGRVRLPARIETIATRPLVVVDAAHNVASMRALIETLAPVLASRRPRVLVFAASGDKQIEQMLATARGGFDALVLTRYTTNPRAATIETLTAAAQRAGLPKPHGTPDPQEALRLARSLAGSRGFVCVAGSFFLATEVT